MYTGVYVKCRIVIIVRLFCVERQTDELTDMTKLIITLSNSGNARNVQPVNAV